MSEEKNKDTQIKNLTMPVVTVVVLVIFILTPFWKVTETAVDQFWRLQKVELIEVLKPIKNELHSLKKEVRSFKSDSMEGRYGAAHHNILRAWRIKNPRKPDPTYKEIHKLVLTEEEFYKKK